MQKRSHKLSLKREALSRLDLAAVTGGVFELPPTMLLECEDPLLKPERIQHD